MEIPHTINFQDLTGMRFGRLLVLSFHGAIKPNLAHKRYSWVCQCDCGTTKVLCGSDIKSGNTSSCGCLQKEKAKNRLIDLTGKVFGKLTVIGLSGEKRDNELLWNCQCECGAVKAIRGVSLRNGGAKSCGCRQGQFIHGKWGKPGYKKFYLADPVKRLRHNVSTSVRDAIRATKSSKKGSSIMQYLPYTIEALKEHLESQFEDWMSWDNYGGANNSKKKSWHIDHIKPQSSFHFTSMNDAQFLECWSLSNLRPLEKIANISKGCRG